MERKAALVFGLLLYAAPFLVFPPAKAVAFIVLAHICMVPASIIFCSIMSWAGVLPALAAAIFMAWSLVSGTNPAEDHDACVIRQGQYTC